MSARSHTAFTVTGPLSPNDTSNNKFQGKMTLYSDMNVIVWTLIDIGNVIIFSFARHKIIKWWCQCFLVGIPVVVCGFRNDHGVVSRLTDYPTVKLPSIGSNFWMPNVCMNFLDSFLTFVKGTVQEEDVLFRFWWDPNASEVHVVKPKHQDPSLVLPSWYKEDIFKTE